MTGTFRLSLMASVAAGAGLASSPAQSQAQDQNGTDTFELQEIVVTAQKRAESAQNVPIAITAFQGDQLSASGVNDTFDLISVTPGLNYTVAAGVYAQPKIRGIGTSSNAPGIENPVATYIDGVYIGSMSGALLNLSDIEQVAVLKGPQGTLFGRNATGGLIQINTRKPSEISALDFNIGYANLETVTASAYLNGKVVDGVSANASVYYQDQGDGFGKNLVNGKDVFKSRTFAGRGKIRIEPGPSTTATFSADYAKIQGPINGLRNVTGSFNVIGQAFNGGPFDVGLDLQPAARLEQWGTSGTIVQDIGDLELQSITAYRKTLNRNDLDYDKSFLPLTNVFIRQYDRQFSQEVQLQPKDKKAFQWIIGAYYLWAKSGYDGTTTRGTTIPNGVSVVQNSWQTVSSVAGYAQGTYEVSSSTNVTGGIRYTTDLRKLNGRSDRILPNGTIVGSSLSNGTKRFSQVTWRAAVDHRFSPELLIYASYNRGFKSGAFLLQSFPSTILKPETIDAFELGFKSDLADRHVRFNAAAFYYDYTNIQVQLINRGLLSAYNGPGAKIYGLDADISANLAEGLTLTLGGSYLHDEYKGPFQAFTATPITPTTPPPPPPQANGGNLIGVGSAAGNKLQAAPDWTFNAGLDYRINVGDGHIDLNATYYRNDGWYAEADNRLKQPGYDTINASAAYSFPGDKLKLTVWGKNLSNTVYAAFLAETDVGDTTTVAAGRTYGVTLSASF